MRLSRGTGVSVFLLLFVLFFSSSLIYAQDIILLKSGEKITGKILSRDNKSIVIDPGIGSGVTYYSDDIVSVNQQPFVIAGQVADTQTVKPAEVLSSPEDSSQKISSPIDKDKLVQDLIESAGLRNECKKMAINVSTIFAGSCPANLSKEECTKAIQSIMPDSLKPEILYKSLADIFKANFDYSQLSLSSQFFNSPLGKKAVLAEAEGDELEAKNEDESFKKQLQINPPPKERMALLGRFDAVKHQTETEINLMQSINNMSNNKEKVDLEEAKKETLEDFMFTYRNITNEDLDQYISFLETDAGKWYIKIVNPWEASTILQAVQTMFKNMNDQVVPEKKLKNP